MSRRVLFVALLAVGACPRASEPPAPSSPASVTPAAPGAPTPAVVGTEPADEIKPVYAGTAAENPLAARLCTLFARYPLDRQATCCQSTAAAGSFEAECTRVVTLALAAGHAKLDSEKLAACETAYKKQLEDCDQVMSSVSPPPASCQNLFAGDVAAGGRCRSNLECHNGLYCAGLGPTDPGTCSAPAPTQAPCHTIVDPLANFTKQSLEAHEMCAGYCNRTRCEDVRVLGADCTFDAQCGAAGRCSAKKCVAGAKVALGGRCVDSGECALAAVCQKGTCRARGKTGSACAADDECLGQCDQGHCGPRCPRAFVPRFSKPH